MSSKSVATQQRGVVRRPVAELPFGTKAAKPRLLNASAAALNQNDQHDEAKNSGDYANQNCAVHYNSPFLSVNGALLSVDLGD
jgi:hypothetical protein